MTRHTTLKHFFCQPLALYHTDKFAVHLVRRTSNHELPKESSILRRHDYLVQSAAMVDATELLFQILEFEECGQSWCFLLITAQRS